MDIKVIGSLESKFESINRVYDVNGCCPTLNTMQGGNREPKILEVRRLGFMDNGTGKHQSNIVYDVNGICPNITTIEGGGTQQIKIVTANSIRMARTEEGKKLRKQYEQHEIHHGFNEFREPKLRKDGISNTLTSVQKDNLVCVAMRGRNPDNPSDRTPGIHLEQRLEVNNNGTCNTLTSVQKDNLVLETVRIRQATQKGYIECELGGVADFSYPESNFRRGRVQGGQICPTLTANSQEIYKIDKNREENNYMDCNAIEKVGQISSDGSQCGMVISDKGLSSTLSAGTHGYANSHVQTEYRIRKLTPKECWRLMGFSDEAFEKAEKVNSNTQLYKQAGNSIVVNVLMAIFKNLLVPDVSTRLDRLLEE